MNTPYYQPLFDYMSNQHGLHLLESDLCEIINIVSKMKNKERIAILEAEISRLNERLTLVEGKLGIADKPDASNPDFIPDWKDAPDWATCKAMDKSGIWNWYSGKPYIEDGVNEWCLENENNKYKLIPNHPPSDKYWTETLEMRPVAEKDYTHLLPEGYEFCSEADAEKWVKVEKMLSTTTLSQAEIGHIATSPAKVFKPYYRPIRPIQYKVTTHEIVNAVPDPYQPDWSQAPERTVAHAWDGNWKGFWYILEKQRNVFCCVATKSNLTFPPDLDWKQSLRIKPSK